MSEIHAPCRRRSVDGPAPPRVHPIVPGKRRVPAPGTGTFPSMGADAWGLDAGYDDIYGPWHHTAPEVAAELHAAMGAERGQTGPPPVPPVWVVRAGSAEPVASPGRLTLED